eukprot:9631127-Ditylum_brightwellii.AAC.1
MPLSQQLCAQWPVKSWDAISGTSIKKSWVVCGYKSTEELINVPNSVNEYLTVFSQSDMEITQEYLKDNDEHNHFLNSETSESGLFLSNSLDR